MSERRPAGPGPGDRCRSRYNLGGQRAEHGGEEGGSERNNSQKSWSRASGFIFAALNYFPDGSDGNNAAGHSTAIEITSFKSGNCLSVIIGNRHHNEMLH